MVNANFISLSLSLYISLFMCLGVYVILCHEGFSVPFFLLLLLLVIVVSNLSNLSNLASSFFFVFSQPFIIIYNLNQFILLNLKANLLLHLHLYLHHTKQNKNKSLKNNIHTTILLLLLLLLLLLYLLTIN